ncbi:hypothetical protein ACFX15_025926 [Malus domestica]
MAIHPCTQNSVFECPFLQDKTKPPGAKNYPRGPLGFKTSSLPSKTLNPTLPGRRGGGDTSCCESRQAPSPAFIRHRLGGTYGM